MMGFTVNQWAILVLVLVLGWLLGLLSRSGGARWRRAYDEECRLRTAADERAAAAEARLATANQRIGELERQLADRPFTAGTAASIGAAAGGRRDDLSVIKGLGRSYETRLNEAGLYSYSQVAALSDADAGALEQRLGLPAGIVAREEWREQAALLRDRDLDRHRARYAP